MIGVHDVNGVRELMRDLLRYMAPLVDIETRETSEKTYRRPLSGIAHF